MSHPYIELRNGSPRTTYENIGPFRLSKTRYNTYWLYTVCVTGEVPILKQASKPSLYDICHALSRARLDKRISQAVYEEYQPKADSALRAQQKEAA